MAKLNRLKFKIALITGLLLAGLSLVTLNFVNRLIDQETSSTIRAELKATANVVKGLLEERRKSMTAQALVLAESAPLKAALDQPLKRQDPNTIVDLARETKIELGLDLYQVTGKRGSLLATLLLDKSQAGEKPKKDSKAADPIFAAAVKAEEPEDAFGAWVSPTAVFETYTRPVIIKDSVLGAIRLGFVMDDTFAKTLKEQTGSDIAVIANGNVLSSSLSPASRQELAASLSSMQGMAKDSAEGSFQASLGGVPFLGQFIPLVGPGQGAGDVAQLLQLRSKESVLALLKRIRGSFLGILIPGVVIAILLSILFAGTITKPLDDLIAGTRAVEKGDLDFKIKISSGDELGELADSFNEMVGDLKEKERVKAVFGRFLPKAVADRAMAHQGELGLGGEEKEVAILFSDIRGFTSLSERMNPREVVTMLNEYYTRMIDVLFENDGTLDKTIGDAIMAVFGAPVSDPDCAVKAVRTALGMMEELGRFNAERQAKGLEPIQIGIGVNTGVVVAGNLGSVKQLSYTVIGDEVNLASRMCSAAKAGKVLITEATWRKVKWQFEFERLEPITVKNVSNPVQVYEVLGYKQQPGQA